MPQGHSTKSRKIGPKKWCDKRGVARGATEKWPTEEEKQTRYTTTAASQATALASQEMRETSIEPDPNPKRRPFMKSASSAPSGSGQQVQRPAGDVKTESPTEVSMDIPAWRDQTPDAEFPRQIHNTEFHLTFALSFFRTSHQLQSERWARKRCSSLVSWCEQGAIGKRILWVCDDEWLRAHSSKATPETFQVPQFLPARFQSNVFGSLSKGLIADLKDLETRVPAPAIKSRRMHSMPPVFFSFLSLSLFKERWWSGRWVKLARRVWRKVCQLLHGSLLGAWSSAVANFRQWTCGWVFQMVCELGSTDAWSCECDALQCRYHNEQELHNRGWQRWNWWNLFGIATKELQQDALALGRSTSFRGWWTYVQRKLVTNKAFFFSRLHHVQVLVVKTPQEDVAALRQTTQAAARAVWKGPWGCLKRWPSKGSTWFRCKDPHLNE